MSKKPPQNERLVQITLKCPESLVKKIDEAAKNLSLEHDLEVNRADVVRRCLRQALGE